MLLFFGVVIDGCFWCCYGGGDGGGDGEVVAVAVLVLLLLASAGAYGGGTMGCSRDRKTGYTKTGYMEEAKTRIL